METKQITKIEVTKGFNLNYFLARLESELNKRNFRVSIIKNKISFSANSKFAYNSEENIFIAMRIFREGSLEVKRMQNEKVEIVSRVKLIYLLVNAIIVGLCFCLLIFYFDENHLVEFIAFGLMCVIIILIIGYNSIRSKIENIIAKSIDE